MGRKRKSEATRLDEVDRTLYSTFCCAANSLSQLYTQSMNQQKISFQAGERHGLNEIGYRGEEPSMSPRLQLPHQYPHTAMHFPNSAIQTSSGIFGQTTVGLAPRPSYSDQTKNTVFSNALSSPVRQSLQHYHLAEEGGSYQNGGNGSRNRDGGSRESNSPSNNDSSMDMHSDSPSHESY